MGYCLLYHHHDDQIESISSSFNASCVFSLPSHQFVVVVFLKCLTFIIGKPNKGHQVITCTNTRQHHHRHPKKGRERGKRLGGRHQSPSLCLRFFFVILDLCLFVFVYSFLSCVTSFCSNETRIVTVVVVAPNGG